jgi:quinolinate synthase
MTDVRPILEDIDRLKQEKRAILLAHNYQLPEIQDLADFLGDSLELSRKAAQTDAPVIVFCGVKFMAETAKILSPDKTVLLPRLDAGCPMADMAGVETLRKMKAEHPGAAVVAYVNSTAEVKAESDVCVTSANAVKIVQKIEAEEILFLPDRNLAAYVQRFTDKKIIPWNGFCYVHEQFGEREALEAKRDHPGAPLLVHPECRPKVIDLADRVLSTSGMLRFVRESDASTFLIGTEEGILHRMKKENPDKTFYSLGTVKTCLNMKKTRLADLHRALTENQHEIKLSPSLMNRARVALEKMLAYA